MKGVNARCPVQIRLLAEGWSLVGNGPSYLLFHAPEKEVTHLSTGLFRELREALKGYSAIEDGELVPLVQALSLISADAIYDVDKRIDAAQRKGAAFIVAREIEELIREFPKRKIFESRLRRLATLIRAAGQFQMYHGPPGWPERGAPGGYFARDRYGQQILRMSGNPTFVFRCEPDSRIARCAQELWRKEQQSWGTGRPMLYRVPTRKELREFLGSDEPTVTKLCRAEGFNWLPRAQSRAARRRHPIRRGPEAQHLEFSGFVGMDGQKTG
jgi:hypothetical protein